MKNKKTDVGVTNYKHVEEALITDKTFIEAIFESIPGMIYVYDEQGNFVKANKRHVEMTGYSMEELSHMNPLSWYDKEEDIAKVKAAINDVFLKGYGEVDVPMRIKDGSILFMHFTGSRLIVGDKRYFVGVGIDISESNKEKETLKESEAQNMALINVFPDILFINKPDGEFLAVHTSHLESLFMPPENFLHKKVEDILPKPISDQFMKTFANALGSKVVQEFNYELLINKEMRYYEARVMSSNDTIITIVRDMTDRKKIEKMLEESEEKHKYLIENSHDIIYTLTADGIFTFVSNAWTVLLGHPVAQVNGHQFQQFVHPDDILGCMTWLKKVIETGERQQGIEYRVKHIDGSWRWHTSSAVPFKDDTGKIVGFEGIARDITERKQAEEKVKEKVDELEKMNKFMVNRELKMVELKKEIELLKMNTVKSNDGDEVGR
ncbi:MAG: PAS domain S-box protein [Candidatus Parcubacteria bacterium]|nr:PAS domain S-box protein [Candidatus Parcubacteria bacterium]